jgi:DNA-binding NtrC family response regulator
MHSIKSLFAPEAVPERMHFPVLAGNSIVINATKQMVQLAASVIDPLFIFGPENSGKAAIAHAVHMMSQLSDQSFLSFDCTNITANNQNRILTIGLDWPKENFQGTIYLHEIGALSLDLQSAMCAWIDRNTLRERPIRLIAGSRHPLDKLATDGQFYPALLALLERLIIPTQPLSRRRQDIQALIMAMWANNHVSMPPSLNQAAWQMLKEHSWPGNFNELQRIAQIMVVAHGGKRVSAEQVHRLLVLRSFRHAVQKAGEPSSGDCAAPLDLNAHLAREEAMILIAALERADGQVQQAAMLAGIDDKLFREKMCKHGIEAL